MPSLPGHQFTRPQQTRELLPPRRPSCGLCLPSRKAASGRLGFVPRLPLQRASLKRCAFLLLQLLEAAAFGQLSPAVGSQALVPVSPSQASFPGDHGWGPGAPERDGVWRGWGSAGTGLLPAAPCTPACMRPWWPAASALRGESCGCLGRDKRGGGPATLQGHESASPRPSVQGCVLVAQ